MYIEPCCIDHQLPDLLGAHPLTFFQTSGDCDVKKFMSAVSCKAQGNLVFFLAIPEVDVYLLRNIAYYLSRKWYEGVILLTQQKQTELVRNELQNHLDVVAYGCHRQILDGAMGIFGTERSVYIQGPMLLEPDYTLCNYTAYYGNDNGQLQAAVEGFFPKIHLSKQIVPTDERVTQVLKYQFGRRS